MPSLGFAGSLPVEYSAGGDELEAVPSPHSNAYFRRRGLSGGGFRPQEDVRSLFSFSRRLGGAVGRAS